jgi:hypothetical protein
MKVHTEFLFLPNLHVASALPIRIQSLFHFIFKMLTALTRLRRSVLLPQNYLDCKSVLLVYFIMHFT